MPGSEDRVQRLERELAQARIEIVKEDARRFRIIMRDIDHAELERIKEGLTNKQERILFGLKVPDEPRRAGARPAGSGDLDCPHCEKSGFTERGLKLHITRMHPGKKEVEG